MPEEKIFAVVRVRGSLGVRRDVERAMHEMRLTRKNHLVLLKGNRSEGALKKVKDYVTWGEASTETVKLLKEKKGERRVYRLSPPRKGFKGGIKRAFPKGALGYRGEKINELVKAML